jgi:hypothetical protein
VSIGNGSVKEADKKNKTCTLTVTLKPAASQLVTAQYATADGSAKAGADYEAKQGTVTFFAGETSQKLSFTVLPDKKHEKDEKFKVVLSNPTGAMLSSSGASGRCTIINDD